MKILEFDYLSDIIGYIQEIYGEDLTPSEFLSILMKKDFKLIDTSSRTRSLTDKEKSIFKAIPTHNGKYDVYINGKKEHTNRTLGWSVDVSAEYKELVDDDISNAFITLKGLSSGFNIILKTEITLAKLKYTSITKDKYDFASLFGYYFKDIESNPTCELLQGLKNGTITDKQFIDLCKGCEI